MDHPGVVAGLVGREPLLPLEHHHPGARPAPGELAGDREPDDPAADDTEHLRAGHAPMIPCRRGR